MSTSQMRGVKMHQVIMDDVHRSSALETWFDRGTYEGRLRLNAPSTMPGQRYMGALTRKGTAHPLDPSAPWMRWAGMVNWIFYLQNRPLTKVWSSVGEKLKAMEFDHDDR